MLNAKFLNTEKIEFRNWVLIILDFCRKLEIGNWKLLIIYSAFLLSSDVPFFLRDQTPGSGLSDF